MIVRDLITLLQKCSSDAIVYWGEDDLCNDATGEVNVVAHELEPAESDNCGEEYFPNNRVVFYEMEPDWAQLPAQEDCYRYTTEVVSREVLSFNFSPIFVEVKIHNQHPAPES